MGIHLSLRTWGGCPLCISFGCAVCVMNTVECKGGGYVHASFSGDLARPCCEFGVRRVIHMHVCVRIVSCELQLATTTGSNTAAAAVTGRCSLHSSSNSAVAAGRVQSHLRGNAAVLEGQ